MASAARKLGLGTVQFGMNYGVSNVAGRIPEAGVKAVLEYARRSGVTTLDTASAYGDSETVLGRNLQGMQGFRIVTKTIPVGGNQVTSAALEAVERGFHTSLERLGLKSLYGILVHHAEDLLGAGGRLLHELISRWKDAGLVKKIGASVYDSQQLRRLTDQFPLDLVQLPINVFDQRLLTDGTLRTLKTSGVEVHARSVFLQGLLLMQPEELPASMQRFAARIAEYRCHLASVGCSPLDAALGFVKHLAEVDLALIGITSRSQLQECIESYDRADRLDLAGFASEEIDLIDPRRWKLP